MASAGQRVGAKQRLGGDDRSRGASLNGGGEEEQQPAKKNQRTRDWRNQKRRKAIVWVASANGSAAWCGSAAETVG
jgi:hypothetical protein